MAETRWRVSGAMGMREGAPLRTRDTVLCETPAAAAISRIVGHLDPAAPALFVALVPLLARDAPSRSRSVLMNW
jgi:hypothetical protein